MTFSLQGRYHSWVAALRIARRDAWRAKGRSALVLSMIALPIVGVSAADLTFRSGELTVEQQLTRKLGGADARLDSSHMGTAIYQEPTGPGYAPVGGYDTYSPSKGARPTPIRSPRRSRRARSPSRTAAPTPRSTLPTGCSASTSANSTCAAR